jgi:hypothetical protein
MIEVLKQALEVLKDFADLIRYDEEYDEIGSHDCCGALSYNQHSESCKATKAIAAIKQAIAQLALDGKAENAIKLGLDYYVPCCTDQTCPKCKAATPPQRTWVGIPEQDLKQGDESFFVAWREGARWAEAKLKELNDHSI